MSSIYLLPLTVALLAPITDDVEPGSRADASQRESKTETLEEESEPIEDRWQIGYAKGTNFTSPKNRFRAHVDLRVQTRFSSPFDSPPRTPADFTGLEDEDELEINRGRLKIGGHIGKPWIEYYLEHDFPSERLLDLRLTLTKYKAVQLRVGQGKAIYSAERVVSSGKQQFTERSIVNREFTLDRQQGIQVFGHLRPGTRQDWRYWLGVFAGNGRGSSNDDDGHVMWMGRVQWNFLGQDPKFSMTDVERHAQPAASLAFAAASNRSRFTRFSSSGGGQLDGFEDTAILDRYQVDQWLGEFTFKRRGLSVLHEYHKKRVDDRMTSSTTELEGAYLQAGYFLNESLPCIPPQLEIAARWAFVDPDTRAASDRRFESTLGMNWFFSGHRNKLTVDWSRITTETIAAGDLTENRVRLQWDVSF